MKEIKFRCWDIGREKMVSNPSISFMQGWMGIDKTCCVNCLFDNEDQLKWMQYTGLRDKNDKEIYEGDCVRFQIHDGATVVWNEDDTCFEFEANNHYCEPSINQECEVVGNVHENPELTAST